MKFKTKKYLIEEGEWRFFRGTRGAMAPLSLSLSLSIYKSRNFMSKSMKFYQCSASIENYSN